MTAELRNRIMEVRDAQQLFDLSVVIFTGFQIEPKMIDVDFEITQSQGIDHISCDFCNGCTGN